MIGATAAEVDAAERAALRDRLTAHREGGVLLATCHRVELYGVAGQATIGAPLARVESAARRHLFRVAAGLESTVPGEDEVLHQVRDALAAARAHGSPDPALQRLFEDAISTGREIRATVPRPPRTSPEGVDLAARAVHWLDDQVSLPGRRVLVVGRGPMGTALAAELAPRGVEVLRASRQAPEGGVDLAGAARLAPTVAAIALALRGPWSAIGNVPAGDLPPIADLSSPSALPEWLHAGLGHRLLRIDDLFSVPTAGRADAEWRARAEAMVEEGLAAHETWRRSRGSTGAIRTLQERAEERRRRRVERYLRGQPDLDEEQARRVELLTRRIVGDLLHEPLSALRADEDGSRAEAVRRLFDL